MASPLPSCVVEQSIPSHPPVILIIDDDAAIRSLMQRVLASKGFVVHVAGDGREGLAIAARLPLSLLVCDLVMPEQEGLETIRAFAKQHPGVPILAMSGAFGGALLGAAQLLGARAALKKPFDPATLVATVESVLKPA